MKDSVEIDGSKGEGGGQMLRTSLALSMLTQRTLYMKNIRVKRQTPGLRAQHVQCVKAAAAICSAKVRGDTLGALQLEFCPNQISSGSYTFQIGTAGSTSLLLQAVLPALWMQHESSTLRLQGGTHVQWAPTFDFLVHSFVPALSKMGIHIDLRLLRYGFYPRGGGLIEAIIHPTPKPNGFFWTSADPVVEVIFSAIVCHLPKQKALSVWRIVQQELDLDERQFQLIHKPEYPSRGRVFNLSIRRHHITETITKIAQANMSPTALADDIVKSYKQYQKNHLPVGEYLADQLLIPLALAREGGFYTSVLSLHTETNMKVIEAFLPVCFEVTQLMTGGYYIQVSPT